MNFEEILATTKYSTEETVKKLIPLYKLTGEFELLEQRHNKEIQNLKEKYPNIQSTNEAINALKKELMAYIKKIIDAIKEDYISIIPQERLAVLEKLLNEENIKIINDPNYKHDFTANSIKGELIINLSELAKGKNIYEKIEKAKGTLPHEIFHFLIKMLKSEELVDERMIINLTNGESIRSTGMVGFMLSEGFVEKFSEEFCKRHIKTGEDFYYTPAPQDSPYIEICNYIMLKNPNLNLNTLFRANYEDILNLLPREEVEQYKIAECISYAIRHKDAKREDIERVRVEKITQSNEEELPLQHLTKEQLEALKLNILTEAQRKELANYIELETKKL